MRRRYSVEVDPGLPQAVARLSRIWFGMLALGTCLVSVPLPAWSAEIDQLPPISSDPNVPTLEDLVGQTIPIQEVTSATKTRQKTTDVPSSVTVITSDEIKFYGHRTLADALRTVPGMYVSYDRNYSFLGVRGFNRGDINSLNSRILLLVDGHRVNNNLTDGATIGNDFILDVDLIDHVEVVRGPGSVLYGNNAFFGVINVVTRKPDQVKHVELSGEYASFDTFKGRLSYGGVCSNGLALMLSGSFYDSDGDINQVTPRLDDEHFGSFFGSASYKGFTLAGALNSRKKGNPTAQFLTATNDSRLRTEDERGYVNLTYQKSIEDVVDVQAQVYYDSYDFNIGYPFTGDPELNREYRASEWWGAELQLTRRFCDRHTLTLGADFRDNFRQSLWYYTDTILPPSYQSSRSTIDYGVYLQGDFAVLTNLHFNAGIRYDQYGDYDPAYNPRLALIYHPWKRSAFKAIYGTAFRAPNFVEPILAFPATGLEPEEITTYELVYEQGIGRNLRTSVAGFYNEIDGLISFDSGSFANQDAIAKGVEFALEGFWQRGLQGRISYSLQQAEDRSTWARLTDSPLQLVKANLTVPLYRDKLFAGAELQYVSQRYTKRLVPPGPGTVAGANTDDFAIVNLTLFSQRLVKGLEFSASVYNLFDTRFYDPATSQHVQESILQDGRTYRLKLTYRF